MSVDVLKKGIISASGNTINPNLVINSDFSSTYQVSSSTWDTTKNGTTLANSWGGYNGGVSNPSTVYHAHMKQFKGEWVYEYIRTSAESWLGVSQGGLQVFIKPNSTYTWSIDQYIPSGSNNYITAGIYYKKTSDGSYNFYSGCPNGTGESGYDRWIRRYYTFTTGEVYTGANISMYIYGHGGLGTVYMRRPKLEVGSKATSWTKAVSENNDLSKHGFIETVSDPKNNFYSNHVEINNLIEI